MNHATGVMAEAPLNVLATLALTAITGITLPCIIAIIALLIYAKIMDARGASILLTLQHASNA